MGKGDTSHQFIAYAVQQFPALRTTFVRREVEALRKLGLAIEVFSMRPANREELRNEAEAAEHLPTTHYLPAHPLAREAVSANAWAALRHPRAVARNLRLALDNPGAPGAARRGRLWLQVWRGAVMARRIRRLGRCRHIHAQFADGAATTALAAARLLGVPFSFTSHTSFDSPALVTKLQEAAFVASISQFDREQLVRAGGAEVASNIHVIHCGIPLEQWPFCPKETVNRPATILSVGALIEKKGHDDLIRACGLLKERGIAFRCEIVGAGPLEGELRRLIRDLGIEDVVSLVGPLPQGKVREKLYAADLFVLASKRAANGDTDGVPVSLMEAMAAGVPVVSCRIAGVPELLDEGRCGWLAAPGSATSLTDAIQQCLASAKRGQVADRAREWLGKRFDQQTEAERLMRLFPAETRLPDAQADEIERRERWVSASP